MKKLQEKIDEFESVVTEEREELTKTYILLAELQGAYAEEKKAVMSAINNI